MREKSKFPNASTTVVDTPNKTKKKYECIFRISTTSEAPAQTTATAITASLSTKIDKRTSSWRCWNRVRRKMSSFQCSWISRIFCVYDSARESQKLPVGAVRKKNLMDLLFIYVPNVVLVILKFTHCGM